MRVLSTTRSLSLFGALASFAAHSLAVSITDIQGPAFLSPLNGQAVANVQGIVTAKGTSGFWISGTRSSDKRVSNGISVFTSSKTILAEVSLGDLITLNGIVAEFRSGATVLSVTEIDSPTNITVLSSNNTVSPVILGVHRTPPTQSFSALDTGSDGIFSVPNNKSQIESVNATLQPDKFGIDFWESLEGQLVTVPNPVAIDFENSFGEFWVHGDWPVTGKNSRGGLTITSGPHGVPDANPETIIIGEPVDGTKNPSVAVGTTLTSITGVVQYQFGFYYVLPLTAPTILTSPSPTVPPTTLIPQNHSCVVTLSDFNIDNYAAGDSRTTLLATQIAQSLKTSDLVHVQEIQDNNGSEDDGTVSANATLQGLVDAIKLASGGVEYAFVDVDPVNDQDGGEPGGNIRQAYLYRPDRIKLAGNSPVGGSLDATAVKVGQDGKLGLTFNPGRIDPNNTAWHDSRKSLAAVWERVGGSGERLFTVNVHHTAKSGGTSEQGNLRPPINEGVDQRTAQVGLVAGFAKSVLAKDPHANVVAAGDFNEFVQTTSVFAPFDGVLSEIDEVAGLKLVERYTYVFDMVRHNPFYLAYPTAPIELSGRWLKNMEQLDHIYISDAIARRHPQVEHVHVNQWAPSDAARSSDHDPSVARFKIC